MASRPVVLVRHAHAEWPHYQGRDFDRPLTSKGEQDALETARALRAAGHVPVRLLTSPARRTQQTAQAIASVLGLAEVAITPVDALYNAAAETLQAELIRRSEATGGLVMLVAHNPGISELARKLAGDDLTPPLAPADWRVVALPAI